MISVHEDGKLWHLDLTRLSSWTKLIRVQAWVRRFIDNCRSPKREREIEGGGERGVGGERERRIKGGRN